MNVNVHKIANCKTYRSPKSYLYLFQKRSGLRDSLVLQYQSCQRKVGFHATYKVDFFAGQQSKIVQA